MALYAHCTRRLFLCAASSIIEGLDISKMPISSLETVRYRARLTYGVVAHKLTLYPYWENSNSQGSPVFY